MCGVVQYSIGICLDKVLMAIIRASVEQQLMQCP